jgi:uncharacterized repeat protein (TIGR01451 family)
MRSEQRGTPGAAAFHQTSILSIMPTAGVRFVCLMTMVLSMVSARAIEVFVTGDNATCGNSTGYAQATASGGQPPYAYLWSTGAQTEMISGLAPGFYSVTVTDANSDQATGNITIGNMDPIFSNPFSSMGLIACGGACNAGVRYNESGLPQNMVPPFSFSPEPWSLDPMAPWELGWGGFCPDVTLPPIMITDALGCTGQIDISFLYGTDPTPMGIVDVTPSCAGMNAGTIMVDVGVGGGGYAPLWQVRLLDVSMQPVPGVNITAYPNAGNNIAIITNRAPGDYFIERRFPNMTGDCVDLLPVTVPDLGPDCGVVSGTAFMDYNGNCVMNVGEVAVGQGVVQVQPGPYFSTLSGSGSYMLSLPPGNYTLQQTSTSVQEHCTGGPIPFSITAGNMTTLNLPDTALVDVDLVALVSSGPARPGFAFHVSATVQSLTPASSGTTITTLTFDPLLTFVSASPAGATVAGNTITWTQGALGGWSQRGYGAEFLVPPDPLLIGTDLVTTLEVTTANTDGDPSNNVATDLRTITGAYDPNDKLAYTSGGNTSVWQINADEWIDYTIRFQNTGTDTAFTVLITDTLPANLDPGTILVGAASHTFIWELRDEGTLKFYFPSILLPDSNINEPLSHGFVGFRIHPRLPLLPGDEIENIANIYFDFNPPVITEPSVLVATTGTGVPVMRDGAGITLFPNPGTDHLHILLDSPLEGRSALRVLGADGRAVWEGIIAGSRGVIDIGGLAPGGYILLVDQSGEGVLRSRFIKQ